MEQKYTIEEIKKLAPKYKGKPENFDPSKMGKPKAEKPKKKMASQLPPPKHLEAAEKPTQQKNTPLWEDSIFSIDTSCRELDVTEEITPQNCNNSTISVYGRIITIIYCCYTMNI
ncbi:hypothetical protein EVAR_76877_1 [Eumeta japonica]|uniref:Uncharacterized protein n=1 Tax=Eumeta variegata TaxID=151549 RepID=A0A4C1SEP6_EUMVA|nr:hypothetical protein EVAR_76877_1 [Eumeta japonica]